jgi:hypothetical protein
VGHRSDQDRGAQHGESAKWPESESLREAAHATIVLLAEKSGHWPLPDSVKKPQANHANRNTKHEKANRRVADLAPWRKT